MEKASFSSSEINNALFNRVTQSVLLSQNNKLMNSKHTPSEGTLLTQTSIEERACGFCGGQTGSLNLFKTRMSHQFSIALN